jgi:hypothetical protein
MPRTVTWVGHTSSLKCRGLFFFGQLVWNILVTVCDLLWCRWIRLIEIFSTVLAVSSSELRCASGFFLYIFSTFFSPPSLHKLQEERKKKQRNKKRPQRHTKVLTMRQPILLERSQRDESNDIKEGHQWWLECATQAVRRQMSSGIFGWPVWPTPITVHNLL